MDLKERLISKLASRRAFEKAKTHKYFKREKTKSGKWKYYYTEADYKQAKQKQQPVKKEKAGRVDLKQAFKGMNIHDYSSIDGALDEYNGDVKKTYKTLVSEGFDDMTIENVQAVKQAKDEKAVEMVFDRTTKLSGEYKYAFTSSIDGDPYCVLMKEDYKFDTSY